MAELNLSNGQMNGSGGSAETAAAVGHTAKRQRRPSVRLGDIGGDQLLGYENHHHHQRRASSKQHQQQHFQWKLHHGSGKASKAKSNETLALALLENNCSKKGVNENENEGEDIEGDLDLDRVAIGSWKSFRDASKSKRGRGGSIRNRVRSNWVSSKIDENEKLLTSAGEGEGEGDGDGEEDLNLDNGINRTFGPENSEEEEERNDSPIGSFENNEDVDKNWEIGGVSGGGLKFDNKNWRRVIRVSDEMEGPSDSVERNGVKVWLNQLGLGRYAPIFEIHEVDDEVLPMLTLEDLKDMGINAVGSRRKMYCSIQKLNRGFS